MKKHLYDIAFARSGDKGSSANIGISVYKQQDYLFLQEFLTKEKVQDFFKSLGVKETIRYELPNLYALNFVLYGALGTGGSRSLRIDSQGKVLAQALLQMEIDNE